MALTINVNKDKSVLGPSGGDVVFSVTVCNTSSEYAVNDITLTDPFDSSSTIWQEELDSAGKTSLAAGECFTFDKTLNITRRYNQRLKARGLQEDWIFDPDNQSEYFLEVAGASGQIEVLDIQLTLTQTPSLGYNDEGKRTVTYTITVENDSVDADGNPIPVYNITVTDIVKLKTKTQEDCVFTETESTKLTKSFSAFDLDEREEKTLDSYTIVLGNCDRGKLESTVSADYEIKYSYSNTVNLLDDQGEIISTDSEVVVLTDSASLTDLVTETEIDPESFTSHWASEDLLKEISGYSKFFHLDADLDIDAILTEADQWTRDRIATFHKKEQLFGLIDGTNKTFCLNNGLELFDGFNFNKIADEGDVIVYTYETCPADVSCECPIYDEVCVECVDKYGNLILYEEPPTDRLVYADFYTFRGSHLDWRQITEISTRYAAYLISIRILEEKGKYYEDKDGVRTYYANAAKDHLNAAISMLGGMVNTGIKTKVYPLE